MALLAVDVGNTQTVYGVYRGAELVDDQATTLLDQSGVVWGRIDREPGGEPVDDRLASGASW